MRASLAGGNPALHGPDSGRPVAQTRRLYRQGLGVGLTLKADECTDLQLDAAVGSAGVARLAQMHHSDLVRSQLAANSLVGQHVTRSFRGTPRSHSQQEAPPHA